MSVEIRQRIATRGFRGDTPNRRVSIATFGYYPITDLSIYWKEIIRFNVNIERLVSFGVER